MNEKEIYVYFSEKVYNDGESDITVSTPRSIPLTEGMSLYDALREGGITLSAPCAGNGTCGACKIKLLEGSLSISQKDKQQLSDEQLKEGWRLSCQAYPTESCRIYVLSEEYVAVTGYVNGNKDDSGRIAAGDRPMSLHDSRSQCGQYGIAIDLGTTTLAYELFDINTGNTVRTVSSANPQRIYGADVVSRMEQSDNGRRDQLKFTLRQGMKKDIIELLHDIEPVKVQAIAISGNTAMLHLLMGYSCEDLGRYPFRPATLDHIHTDAVELNLMDRSVPLFITGGISAYVGGDVLVGIAAQKIMSEKEPCLFIDLGTNAEMALFDGKGKIYVTSAPAGPAFEAANISCGVGSIEGAVSGISIQNGQQTLITIGKKEPLGFCGSGILEAVYELLANQIIDDTGLLEETYFEIGYPVEKLRITQQDIRQIQLAKSAVFSAIHLLMKKAEVTICDIKKVYLAGGFGYHLNVKKAVGIGLLPEKFSDKIQAVGNTSLYGSKGILMGEITENGLNEIKNICEEIYLSNENDFQSIFMENMNFKRKYET